VCQGESRLIVWGRALWELYSTDEIKAFASREVKCEGIYSSKERELAEKIYTPPLDSPLILKNQAVYCSGYSR
jgi:hypothetical protein